MTPDGTQDDDCQEERGDLRKMKGKGDNNKRH
jgi:hypothetical protein